jgi:hypothetical protein
VQERDQGHPSAYSAQHSTYQAKHDAQLITNNKANYNDDLPHQRTGKPLTVHLSCTTLQYLLALSPVSSV